MTTIRVPLISWADIYNADPQDAARGERAVLHLNEAMMRLLRAAYPDLDVVLETHDRVSVEGPLTAPGIAQYTHRLREELIGAAYDFNKRVIG